ncbi:MAG: MBL fold metallo-hydrolase [Saprospiraceae bacterium]|nr:MBL fold metallo-hydrolase [Saprospiraceae bacterium]
MKLHPIETGFLKLDGGAMFGIVPKSIWHRRQPADERNLCTWALRCLLIELDDRLILVDTGIGDKIDDTFRKHFEPHGKATLRSSLAAAGFQPEDITDVFLTHLHFDHAGGATCYDENRQLVPAFPNATYWTNDLHYQWALHPNARERASFVKANFVPLENLGLMRYLEVTEEPIDWLPGIRVQFVYGHTEAMMLLHLMQGEQHLVYCADLIPSSFHIGLPYIMSYDVRPLKTLQEKTSLLEQAAEHHWLLFFEHDPTTSCATVKRTEEGRIELDRAVELAEVWLP